MVNIVLALLGGLLIGFSAVALLYFDGRILGISGMLGGLVRKSQPDKAWRLFFLLGLTLGGAAINQIDPSLFEISVSRSSYTFILAGLLVGYGTRLGNGCTSGHGVCGMARLSLRSITATVVFMIFGMLSTYAINHIWEGRL